MALPLDARIPDEDLKRARKALQRAKAVGEEYQGVEVATATVRARSAGEGIVREAKRRGVEAIVLAAEEPTRMRGGPLLGGKRGLYDTFVGRDDALRGQQGALPRDPHRAAGRRRPAAGAARPRRALRPAADRRSDAAGRGGLRQRRDLRRGRGGAHAGWLESAPNVRARRRCRAGSAPPWLRLPCARATPSPCSTRTRSRTSGSTSSSARAGRRPAGASRSARRSRWTR